MLFFFDPKNSNNLSKILIQVLKEKNPKTRNVSFKKNQKKLSLKIEKYMKKYIDMIN